MNLRPGQTLRSLPSRDLTGPVAAKLYWSCAKLYGSERPIVTPFENPRHKDIR
jgi:hypothetical protein